MDSFLHNKALHERAHLSEISRISVSSPKTSTKQPRNPFGTISSSITSSQDQQEHLFTEKEITSTSTPVATTSKLTVNKDKPKVPNTPEKCPKKVKPPQAPPRQTTQGAKRQASSSLSPSKVPQKPMETPTQPKKPGARLQRARKQSK